MLYLVNQCVRVFSRRFEVLESVFLLQVLGCRVSGCVAVSFEVEKRGSMRNRL